MILGVSKMVHVKKKNLLMLYHEGLKVFYYYHVESRLMIPIYSHYYSRMMCYFDMCHLIVEKGLLLYHHQYAYFVLLLVV